MTPLADQSAGAIAAAVRSGALSATAVAKAALADIAARNGALNCFTATVRDRALEAAAAVDVAVAEGRDPGPLAGAPFAVKNLFDIEGAVTLAGSIIDADLPPATADAALVQRLQDAGAVLVGALNMDEYAYGFSTENSHYGATRNPHDPTRIAGGSSGGSAAAVAAGLVPISLGSDTNGSIRVPAALCGVFGLKPTFGRLSRRGARPFVHSLDHVGPFARTAHDLALVYDALQGFDVLDPASVDRPADPVLPLSFGAAPKLRTGVLGGWFRESASLQAQCALDAVASRLQAHAVRLDAAAVARAAAFCLSAAEGGALHLPNLRRRPRDFDPTVRDRLIAGALQPAAVLATAHRVRRWFLERVLALFDTCDLLIAPTTPFAATPIGQATTELDGAPVLVRATLGLFTQPFSFIGLPVMSAPVTVKAGLPMGVQLIAPPWREDRLFAAAAWLENEGVCRARLPSALAGGADLLESRHGHQ